MAGTNFGTAARGKRESCIRIVNNKGIPKGKSSQIERGEEREREREIERPSGTDRH